MQFQQVRLEVGADPVEVGRARVWVRDRLAGCGVAADDEQLAETVVLLVSELVTNAVVHTGRPAVLSMSLPRDVHSPGGRAPDALRAACAAEARALDGACTLRIEVSDCSRTAPLPRHAEGEDTGGRGLELVSGLADRWGWHHEGDGKHVWCEFDRVPGGGARAQAGETGRDPGPAAAPPRPRGPMSLRPTF